MSLFSLTWCDERGNNVEWCSAEYEIDVFQSPVSLHQDTGYAPGNVRREPDWQG